MSKLTYLAQVVKAYFDVQMDETCPFCHHTQAKVLGRKYLVVQLRKCEKCGLMFRFPKETPETNLRFYQSNYKEGMTTDLPDSLHLKHLLSSRFQGTSKDFESKINLVKSYLPTGIVLDYGCSWGYGVWQFKQAGYEAIGFEISQPRADFGRKMLGVDIIQQEEVNNLNDASIDIIFTSHVLEHLPDISNVFKLFQRLLKSGGILAIFVPNCNECDNQKIFHQKKIFAFGEKHTIAYDSLFLSSTLEKHQMSVCLLQQDTSELQVIAQKI